MLHRSVNLFHQLIYSSQVTPNPGHLRKNPRRSRLCKPSKQIDHWRQLDAVLSEPQIAAIPSLRLFIEFHGTEASFVAPSRKSVEEALPGFRHTSRQDSFLLFAAKSLVFCKPLTLQI